MEAPIGSEAVVDVAKSQEFSLPPMPEAPAPLNYTPLPPGNVAELRQTIAGMGRMNEALQAVRATPTEEPKKSFNLTDVIRRIVQFFTGRKSVTE